MKILLVYPEFPDTFWSFKHALKFVKKRASSPPLGLLTVAALLPPEWDKKLIDLNAEKLRDSDIDWADYIFIGAMVVQRDSATSIIARCKKLGKTVVAGGPLFTSEHENFPLVDHFVLNEAELTLPEFLKDLANGIPQPMYQTDRFPDVTRTPAPLWELVDMRRYASMSIQYSRGCPYQCEFCNVTALFGHRPRTKTSDQVIHELNGLYNQGWRDSIFFVDDNFIGNRRILKSDLLPRLIEWQKDKAGITFHTEVSINLADDDELMRMMSEAGFDQVFVGIETPDDESLAECSKKQNRGRNLLEDVRKIQNAGLQVQGGFIVGFDSDTPSIFKRQVEFIQKSGIVTAMVGLLQAVPGTKLYDRMKNEGRLLGEITGDNVNGTTNIVPTMDLDTLKNGYRQILENIYDPRNYYRRVKTFLREYKAPKINAPFSLTRIMAFVRSMFRLGVFGRERFYYWNLLIWTGLRRPRLLPLAVSFTIYGHHFRRICELHLR